MPEAPHLEPHESPPRESVAGQIAVPVTSLPPRFKFQDVFIGPDGLRSGWGIILYLTLFYGLLIGSTILKPQLGHEHAANGSFMSPMFVLANELPPLLCMVFATAIMARFERRSFSVYGFRPQRRLRNFCAGLGWGVALLSLLVLILRATGLLVVDTRLLFSSSALRYGILWLGEFLLVGLFEESYIRGYLQFTLTRGLSGTYRWLFGTSHANAFGFWTAALILSFAFAIGHGSNPGESPLGLLSAGVAGFLFCLSLWRTGSLWWAIGFHASWDWAQSFLYGVPDSGLMIQGHLLATHPVGRPFLSGGLTGPEGSLFLLPVLLGGAVVIFCTLPRTCTDYTPAITPQPSLH